MKYKCSLLLPKKIDVPGAVKTISESKGAAEPLDGYIINFFVMVELQPSNLQVSSFALIQSFKKCLKMRLRECVCCIYVFLVRLPKILGKLMIQRAGAFW